MDSRIEKIAAALDASMPARGGLLVETDVRGLITAARGDFPGLDADGMVGREIGEFYFNPALPLKTQALLAEGGRLEDFKKLIGAEEGIVGVHGFHNGRLAYDTLIRTADGFKLARIVEKALTDGDAVVGFSRVFTDPGKSGTSEGADAYGKCPKAIENPLQLLSLTGNVLVAADAGGQVTFVYPEDNVFGFGGGLVGKNVSLIFANNTLPKTIGDMLAGEKGAQEYGKLAESTSGLLAWNGFRGYGASYDALLRLSGRMAIANVVEWAAKDDGGQVRELGFLLSDATESYSLRQKAAILSKRLDEVTRRINDIVYVRDIRGRITYLSPSVENILGYSPSKMQNQIRKWPINRANEFDPRSLNSFACGIVDSDGRTRHFELSESWMEDLRKGRHGVYGVLRERAKIASSAKEAGRRGTRKKGLRKTRRSRRSRKV